MTDRGRGRGGGGQGRHGQRRGRGLGPCGGGGRGWQGQGIEVDRDLASSSAIGETAQLYIQELEREGAVLREAIDQRAEVSPKPTTEG